MKLITTISVCCCWLIIFLNISGLSGMPVACNTNTNTTTTIRTSDLSYWEYVNKTCLSRECDEHVNIKHLQHMATHMNRSIDPCENFHQYACSNWQTQHGQHHTMMAVGEQQLTEKYQRIFEDLKESPQLKEDKVYEKLQQYYQVCLASERREPASWHAYVEEMREMGYLQFSNTSHWLTTHSDLSLFLNPQYFIAMSVDRVNASLFMLNISPHNVLAKADLDPQIYELFKSFDLTNESLHQVAATFKSLEIDLENILRDIEEEIQLLKTTNYTVFQINEYKYADIEWSFGELLSRNSSLNWTLLLEAFPLQSHDMITLSNLAALENINAFLNNSTTYSQKTLFLYALTRFINQLQSQPHNIVNKGSNSLACLRHMRKIFPMNMNYIYEKIFYTPEQRLASDPVIESIFEQLKQQFFLRLQANEMQLSADSLQYLKRKLDALQLNIGNLPRNVTAEFYEEFIRDLSVTNNNFYRNHLQALRHFFERQRRLASPSKFSAEWYTFILHLPDFMDNMDSTAYYFCGANLIVLPFAYLQLPFYDHHFWPSLLYGDLANTLGHELIHAFDTSFLRFDYGGNYNSEMSDKILSNPQFVANRECLEKSPTQFLTERIADISGTLLALRTFVKDPLFLKHNGKLFFLQFAQFFCGSASQQSFALEDPNHDMDSVRLNYTLAHMPEFAKVFECPLGSPMNPVEKCKLW